MNNLIENVPAFLSDKLYFVKKTNELFLERLKNGILIIYTSWSFEAISNNINTLAFLDKQKYQNCIIVLDKDIFNDEEVEKILGCFCEGWREIFVFENGKVKTRYLGKDCYNNFSNDFLNRFISSP